MTEMQERLVNASEGALWRPLVQYKSAKKPTVIVRGHATTVWDEDGNAYLDAMAGLYCVNVGYGRREMVDAAAKQMMELAYAPLSRPSSSAVKYANRLADVLPGTLNHVVFTNSGSEAVETALKMARQSQRQRFPGESRYKIIARYRTNHGFSMGALGATGQVLRKHKFEPTAAGYVHVKPTDSADEIGEVIEFEGPETVAAVIAEPVISGGGVIPPRDDFFPKLRSICDKFGVLLIADEVLNGFGRLGTMFGCEQWGDGVLPDIITLAKGITSGYMPMGATVASEAVFETFVGDLGSEFAQISTFGGHPVAAAVAIENLKIMQREALAENSAKIGSYLKARLQALRHPAVGEVRGRGLLIGMEIVAVNGVRVSEHTVDEIVAVAQKNGVLLGRNVYTVAAYGNVLVMSPPLVLTESEADRIVQVVHDSLNAVIK